MKNEISKNIDQNKRITSKILGFGISSIFIYPFFKILNQNIAQNNIHKIDLNTLNYKNIFVDNQIIIHKNENLINIFQNKCTHLGCKIILKNNELICPCHGSKYSENGVPIKGPAINNLKKLNFIIKENNILVDLT